MMTFRLYFMLFSVFFLSSCMEKEFGYKNNPAQTLVQAHKFIMQENSNQLSSYLGREALCLYGSSDGLLFLKNQLQINIKSYEIDFQILSKGHLNSPKYIGSKSSGYWSYFNEEYKVSLIHKKSRTLIAESIISCDFGFDGMQSREFLKFDSKQYKIKNCRITKIIGHELKTKEVSEDCRRFAVDL